MYPLGPEDPRMYEKTTTTELNQLFGAARAGSRQALEYLLMALRRRIYRKARRYTAGRPQVIGPSSLTQELMHGTVASAIDLVAPSGMVYNGNFIADLSLTLSDRLLDHFGPWSFSSFLISLGRAPSRHLPFAASGSWSVPVGRQFVFHIGSTCAEGCSFLIREALFFDPRSIHLCSPVTRTRPLNFSS